MFERYVIKRITKLGCLVKTIREGGLNPEESDVLVAVLERDRGRRLGDIDIVFSQKLGTDVISINRERR